MMLYKEIGYQSYSNGIFVLGHFYFSLPFTVFDRDDAPARDCADYVHDLSEAPTSSECALPNRILCAHAR